MIRCHGPYARACHKTGEMNQYERAYAAVLEKRKLAGEIQEYHFERYKLRLGQACYYTPDFAVVRADGVLEFHEVKGFWEEDARVKIKAAADQYPHVFVAVTRPKTKAQRELTPWLYEYFTKEDTTAPAPQAAPQPAEPPACKNCKWFDMNGEFPCRMWQTIVGHYTPVCHKFTPKEQ